MKITKLKLKNFRSITSFDTFFNSNKIIIIGENGIGKTTVVESIYYCCFLTSFKIKNNLELMKFNSDITNININFNLNNNKNNNLNIYFTEDKNNDQSYYHFMNVNLFNHIDINKNNTFIPDGYVKHIETYENQLKNNPIDVQLLGIGSNGHIAFNEPGTSFDSTTHKVDLAQKTINDNARFFNSIDEVPTSAITMGLSNIMSAKKIILIATGESKSDVIAKLFNNADISVDIPASILKKHPDVTFFLDEDAAKHIK